MILFFASRIREYYIFGNFSQIEKPNPREIQWESSDLQAFYGMELLTSYFPV